MLAGCWQQVEPRSTASVFVQATATSTLEASCSVGGIRFRTPSEWSFTLASGQFRGRQGLTVKLASHRGQKLDQNQAWELVRPVVASEGLEDLRLSQCQRLSRQDLEIWSLEGQATRQTQEQSWRVLLIVGDKEILSFRCGAEASTLAANEAGWQQLIDSLSREAPDPSPTASPQSTPGQPTPTGARQYLFRNLEYYIPKDWKEVDGGKWLTPDGIWVLLWASDESLPLKAEGLPALLESSGNFRDIHWEGSPKGQARGDFRLWSLQGKARWNKQTVRWFACLPEPTSNSTAEKHTFFLACASPERSQQAQAALQQLAATIRLQTR